MNPEGIVGGTPDSFEVEFKGGRKALFANPRNIPFRVGDHAVVDFDRGQDIGVVIREGDASSTAMKEKGVRGPMLRRATARDLAHLSELREKEAEAHGICQQCIATQELPMKLVDVEWQFDGNKIRFYFTSDHRVDFRKLVRDLAATFKTRIEMRQIGVRDEARRLGGFGRCGRYYCCRGAIQDFDPVTLRMVKEQHLAPGSPKISGGCGRLMCCLRYERDFYASSSREFPKVGTRVSLGGRGRGRVVGVDIFRRKVTIADEEGTVVEIAIEDWNDGKIAASALAGASEKDAGFVDMFGEPLRAPVPGGRRESAAGDSAPARGARGESDRPSEEAGESRGEARAGRRRGGSARRSGRKRDGGRERDDGKKRDATGEPRGERTTAPDESRKDGDTQDVSGGGDSGKAASKGQGGEPSGTDGQRKSDGKRRSSGRSRRRRGGRRRSSGGGSGTDGKGSGGSGTDGKGKDGK